jgi:hypothetical protein
MTATGSDRTLLALYDGLEEAVQACRRLVDGGVAPESMSVLSDVPLPEGVFPVAEPRLPLQWFSLAGGVVGIAAGIALTVGTSLAYPIRTGHMPILPIPPYAIISYEVMMLFAILATVAGFVRAVLRGGRRNALYDVAVDEGAIGLLVYCPEAVVAAKARRIIEDGESVRLREAPGRHL